MGVMLDLSPEKPAPGIVRREAADGAADARIAPQLAAETARIVAHAPSSSSTKPAMRLRPRSQNAGSRASRPKGASSSP